MGTPLFLFTITDHLEAALAARREERGDPAYVPGEDGDAFEQVYAELRHYAETGTFGVKDLLDPRHWRIDVLRTADDRIRKPKLALHLYITGGGGFLAMDYGAANYPEDKGGADFHVFRRSNAGGWGSEPPERMITLRGFTPLLSRAVRHGQQSFYYPRSSELLFRGIEHLLDRVRARLSCTLDVESAYALRLITEYISEEIGERLVKVELYDVEEDRRQTKEREAARWLRDTFEQGLGITPDQLLDAYDRAGRVFARTVPIVEEMLPGESKPRITAPIIARLVRRLESDYPSIYQARLGVQQPA